MLIIYTRALWLKIQRESRRPPQFRGWGWYWYILFLLTFKCFIHLGTEPAPSIRGSELFSGYLVGALCLPHHSAVSGYVQCAWNYHLSKFSCLVFWSSRSFPCILITAHVYTPFVSRKFLAKNYGLSPQSFIGKIKAECNIPNSQLPQVSFPQHVQNPGLPTYPGAAGTILANRLELLDDPHWSLFLRAKDKALWVYAGNYLIEKNEKLLSPVEFAALPPKVSV